MVKQAVRQENPISSTEGLYYSLVRTYPTLRCEGHHKELQNTVKHLGHG